MHVEAVRALSPDKRAVVAGEFTIGTTRLEGVSTDSASAIIGAPTPGCHAEPIIDLQGE